MMLDTLLYLEYCTWNPREIHQHGNLGKSIRGRETTRFRRNRWMEGEMKGGRKGGCDLAQSWWDCRWCTLWLLGSKSQVWASMAVKHAQWWDGKKGRWMRRERKTSKANTMRVALINHTPGSALTKPCMQRERVCACVYVCLCAYVCVCVHVCM